jgi:hypothetical protein
MSDKIYYTDTLAAAKRFEKAKTELLERKRVEDIRAAIPQGHNSGLNADMVDDYHASDLLREVSDMIARIPHRGGGGGGGTAWYDGAGAPNITGADGDYYLDNATGDIYHNTVGIWAIVGNITGGVGGGSVWYNGAGVPS